MHTKYEGEIFRYLYEAYNRVKFSKWSEKLDEKLQLIFPRPDEEVTLDDIRMNDRVKIIDPKFKAL